MSLQNKTKEELLIELERIQKENVSLKESHNDFIADLRRSEEMLLESNQKLKDILNSTTDVIWSSTWPDYKVLFISSSAEIIFGRPLKEFYENRLVWKEIVHPDDQLFTEEAIDLLVKNGKASRECRIIHPDGHISWIYEKSELCYDENGNPVRIFGIASDITERKHAEAIFRDIIEKNPMSIQILDMEGYTIQTNPAFRKLFGVAPPEDYSIIKDTQLLQQGFRDLFERIKNGEVVFFPDSYFNVHNVDPSFPDAPCWIRAIGFTINDLKGIPERIVLMHENITDRKLAEVEILKAKERAEESDLLKSAFLANMSHEIRTPMNGILGFAELLKEPELSGDLQKRYIEIIEKSGHRMLNIINDIVDISKIESGQMKVVVSETNINEQLEFLYTFFKPETQNKGIQLSYKNGLPDNKSIIKTDKEKVYAILTNIIKNAIKYSDKGFIEFGYIVKKCNDTAVGSLLSGAEGNRNIEMEFFIKDTGIGIPGDRIHAVFDRFVQADIADKRAIQGAGLGLSISKAYVEMLGGKIWVESREGKGSTFYFTLPYSTVQEENHVINNIVSDESLSNQAKKLKIMIAEDDETSELLITMIIKDCCSEIIKVRTGREAVKACRENPDIDLILMDLQMPEMNGDVAASQIRHFNKDIVIIAQTAYGLTGDREKAIEAGCNDYISKPISRNELLEKILKHCDKCEKNIETNV